MSASFASLLLILSLMMAAFCSQTTASDDQGMHGHLEAFGRQGPSLAIDQVTGFLPPKEFVENYLLKNRPVVFKGAAKHSPAFHKWTDAYLNASAPPRPAGDVFLEHKKKESRSQTYSYVHLTKFLEIYNTSDIYMVSDVPSFLLRDVVLPFSLQCKYFIQGGLDTHVTWFSSGGTSSVIHHDAYENINCLYRGRKTLVFLNTTKYSAQVEKIIDKVEGSYSSADVDKIDLVARPEFRGLEFHLAEMDTGDCLYIPLLWVHQVRSFENNLAVNIWWPPKSKYPLDLCMSEPSSKLTFDKVYFKTLEQTARSDVDFTRQIIRANLPIQGRSEAALIELFSGGEPERLSANQEFFVAVSTIFRSLDADKDGELSEKELRRPLKRKEYRPAYSAINAYNVIVFRMHEAVGSDQLAAQRLPKLLLTSNSDQSVFAPLRTWRMSEPMGEVDDDEFDLSGMQPVTNAVETDGQEAAKVLSKKDEL